MKYNLNYNKMLTSIRLGGKRGAGSRGRGTGSRDVENTGCGKHGAWKTRGLVENTGSKWKTRGLSGKRGVPFFSPNYEFSSP